MAGQTSSWLGSATGTAFITGDLVEPLPDLDSTLADCRWPTQVEVAAAGWQRENIFAALTGCDGYTVDVGYVRSIPNLTPAEIVERDDALIAWACGIAAMVQRDGSPSPPCANTAS
jgi:hypothetical protein